MRFREPVMLRVCCGAMVAVLACLLLACQAQKTEE